MTPNQKETWGQVFKHQLSIPETLPLVLSSVLLLATFLIVISFKRDGIAQHFTLLAESFSHLRLDYVNKPDPLWGDTSLFNGRHYLPLGPFPAVVLLPFVLIGNILHFSFAQQYVQAPLVLLIFFLWYKIAAKVGYTSAESLYWSLAFMFGSVFIGVAVIPASWQFAQIVAVTLLLLLICEFFGKKRLYIFGLIIGLLLATRITAGLGSIVFIGLTLFTMPEKEWRKRVRNVFQSQLLLPIIAVLTLLLLYNYLRFQNPFETGYNYQILATCLTRARDYGLFGLVHLPGNLYYAVLAVPTPVLRDGSSHVLAFPYIQVDPWGMSIFITSPYLFLLFFLKYKDQLSKILITSASATALLVFLYYGIGYIQYGYRYALDFLPFLFVLILKNYHEQRPSMTREMKICLLCAVAVNLFLLGTFLSKTVVTCAS